jgi:hypothetical protein
MRTRHLILVTPLLGAGLVLGTVEAPQAAITTGPAKTIASNAVHRSDADGDRRHKKRKRAPGLVGYRDGYRQGFADGRNDCRRRTGHRRGYMSGWMAGYNSGFSEGCAQSRRHRPGGYMR